MSLTPFDDRDGWIWLNGRFVPWRDAKIHVLTHGMHYASCVFEGERMYDGEIFKLREHTERLFKSAAILDFAIPYSVAEIDAACIATCERNGLRDGYVRPLAWRGLGDDRRVGPEHPHQRRRRRLGVAELLRPRAEEEGIRLAWAKYKRPSPETPPPTPRPRAST
jgi:branched-chain amino acid aminotransferase